MLERGGEILAGGFDPVAARQAVASFAFDLERAKAISSTAVEIIQSSWDANYMRCGHKALGRLMIGKSVDEACRSFER